MQRFNSERSIEGTVNVSGALWALKVYPAHQHMWFSVDISNGPKVVFRNLGTKKADHTIRWVWTPHRLWTERPDGAVVSVRDMPRDAFEGHTLRTPWDDFHLLYFQGYALWNHLSAPFYFTWPGCETQEVEPHREGEQQWRVLQITYPDGFPTQCKGQRYMFDKDFKLRRLDYVAEVVREGEAAHYCFDHKNIGGILFPMPRRVLRLPEGELNGGPSMVLLDICDIVVVDGDSKMARV